MMQTSTDTAKGCPFILQQYFTTAMIFRGFFGCWDPLFFGVVQKLLQSNLVYCPMVYTLKHGGIPSYLLEIQLINDNFSCHSDCFASLRAKEISKYWSDDTYMYSQVSALNQEEIWEG